MSQSIRIRRGLAADLPTSAALGELLGTTDTKIIYMGQGAGQPLLNMSAITGGGGGVNIARYEIGGTGSGSYVHATGAVGDVTLSITGNAATLVATNGAHIFSASIHYSAAQMTGFTTCTIDFGTNTAVSGNIPGSGDNSSFATMTAPQFQCWADVNNARSFRTTVTGNLNASPTGRVLSLQNLTSAMPIWVNISF
jgi:hypothetical protein